MSHNEPLILANTGALEATEVSPAVAEIIDRAHKGAMLELERFAADETNPFLYYLREANQTVAAIILGKKTDPAHFSAIITLKKRLRDKEAANEENFKKVA